MRIYGISMAISFTYSLESWKAVVKRMGNQYVVVVRIFGPYRARRTSAGDAAHYMGLSTKNYK